MSRLAARLCTLPGCEPREEVFRLEEADIFGIHIGEDDHTAASYYLKDQSEVLGLLNSMVGVLDVEREAEAGMSNG